MNKRSSLVERHLDKDRDKRMTNLNESETSEIDDFVYI